MNSSTKLAALLLLVGASSRLTQMNERRKRRRPNTESGLESKRFRHASVSTSEDEEEYSSASGSESDYGSTSESDSEFDADSWSSYSFSSSGDDEHSDEGSLSEEDYEEDELGTANYLINHDIGRNENAQVEIKVERATSPVDEKPDIETLACQLQAERVPQLDGNTFTCIFESVIKLEPDVQFG